MNFISEVLRSADEINPSDIQNITKNIDHFKREVSEHLHAIYVEFEPIRNTDILERSQNISEELSELISKIQEQTKREINTATNDLKRLSMELQETRYILDIIIELIKIDDHFHQFEENIENRDYIHAAHVLSELKELIDKPLSDIKYLEVLASMKDRYLECRFKLLNPFKTVWQDCLNLKELSDEKCASIKVNVGTGCLEDMPQAIKVLYILQKNEVFSEMKMLSNFLMEQILKPVITSTCIIKVTCDENVILEICIENPEKPQYKLVFENIITVFDFLKNYIDLDITKQTTVLQAVGKMIGKEFCDTLIKQCLVHTIPSTLDELNNYNMIIEEVQRLQIVLFDAKFLSENQQSILDYANNIDVLFANKLCDSFIRNALVFMKKDLYNMTEVGNDTSDNSFPKCQVSSSTIELMELITEALDLATQSSDMCAGRLIQIVQNIFELYRTVTPDHHKKFLKTIPQQAALFHNNCMYLADCILKLENYKERFSNVLKIVPITFVDNFVLKDLGRNILLEQIRIQKQQLLDILKESELANFQQTPELAQSSEKSVRQCLRQLEILQTVWSKVLPVDIYHKSMGCLIDAFIEDLINKIIVVEDISAETAIKLVYLFNMVKQRAPKVLEEPNEIHRHAKLWMKFNELIFILEATLIQIEARWADGKGPLAAEFKASEIKSLIKALFQNTDRRATVLNRIM